MPKDRIALATFGSYGDLHPYLAIARELKRRGRHPVIATVAMYKDKVESAGLEFRLLRTAQMEQPNRDLMRRIFHVRSGARFLLRDMIMPELPVAYADARTAFADASLVVVHPLTFGARLAAEVAGIPWVSTQLAPMGFFSAYDPPVIPAAPVLDNLRVFGPAVFHPLLGLAKRSARSWTRVYEQLRAELDLPPSRDPLFDGGHSPAMVLALFSRALGEPMPDWPKQTVVTGFPFYDGEDQALPPELEAFLAAGEPPIVFTLGSSAVMDAGSFFAEGAAAAQLLGRRAVLLVGNDPANVPANLPHTILPVPYAQFSLLFPRSAAIVHQGGVGTTGQAMRSGRPMLVMPYAYDQQDNAERACRLGIARVLSRGGYSRRTAARVLGELLRNPEYERASARVAQQLATEDGAAAACDCLERFAERGHLAPYVAPQSLMAEPLIPSL